MTTEDYTNPWNYQGQKFSPTDDELEIYTGFVYIIEALAPELNKKKYVGQKLLWGKTAAKKNKDGTKKRGSRRIISSDWKKYYGSSEDLKKDIEVYGVDAFKRTILHLCKSKSEMNYLELLEQMNRRVLFRDDYYNGFLGTKIHKKHVASLREPRDSQEE